MLPVRKALDRPGHAAHLLRQNFGHLGRAPGATQDRHQQKDQKNKPTRTDQSDENQRITEGVTLLADLDHVRPKSLSISDSFSST
jgi:hypothetical protein